MPAENNPLRLPRGLATPGHATCLWLHCDAYVIEHKCTSGVCKRAGRTSRVFVSSLLIDTVRGQEFESPRAYHLFSECLYGLGALRRHVNRTHKQGLLL